MSFRFIPDAADPFHSHIALTWLEEDFKPVGESQILALPESSDAIPSRSEDARLIDVNGRLFLVYSNNKDEKISKGGFRVYVGEIDFDGENFSISHSECLSHFEGESKLRREKNWVPFTYEEELLLAYSLSPHHIFRPVFGTESCETVISTPISVDWDWGELRGGTPALPMGDCYLAFFHSVKKMATVHSNEREIPHYFMGAYTFSLAPPFTIKEISPEPIVGTDFYKGASYSPYWGSVRVVFPGGYLLEKEFIWIAYGRQDHEIWIVKLNKEKLLKGLITL